MHRPERRPDPSRPYARPAFDDVPRPGGTISLLVAAVFVVSGLLIGWALWA